MARVIPLIFANRTGEYGGVRVDTDMLFSQMVSSGNNQLLYAIMTFGMGQLAEKPDYDGFAIGDLLLRDFANRKNRLYYTDRTNVNNRISSGDKYTRSKLEVDESTDAFSIWWPRTDSWEQFFSGTRSPSTKTQFGAYGPIANGHRFYVPYELVMRLKKSGKEAKRASDSKREKVSYPFPRMCGITRATSTRVTYLIDGEKKSNEPDWAKPWGIADAISIMNESRITADEVLQENQEFLLGSTLATLISRPAEVWAPEDQRSVEYVFRIDERNGTIPVVPWLNR